MLGGFRGDSDPEAVRQERLHQDFRILFSARAKISQHLIAVLFRQLQEVLNGRLRVLVDQSQKLRSAFRTGKA